MYLKRLDLQGFKSFPDKLKLEFNEGITAVVGPNGSGKSNISDAVRWVLGEQSAKSLRGAKMEDIIFTGTANRKPLGFAEVSITLDNIDRTINIDYSEVTVTRRVYRSGESEYQLNGTACRLKDIHELFTDTGIGKEGYSIIGQGRIDEILSTKSEDRRNMFEEAAGILKFKNRREEAKLKLDREKENLVRVEDIIATLEGQVEPLKIQSEKSKKYLQLKERLKVIEVNIFLIEVENMQTEIGTIETTYNTAVDQLNNEKVKYDQFKKNQQSLRDKIEDLNTELQNIQKEFYDIGTEVEKNESNIKITQEQINFMLQDLKRIQNEMLKKNEQIEQLTKNRENYLLKVHSTEIQVHSQQNLLDEKQKALYELTNALSKNETLINEYNTDIVEKIRQLANVKSDIQNTQSMRLQLQARKEQIDKESNYNISQINDKNVRIQVLEKSKTESLDIERKLLDAIENANDKKVNAQKGLHISKKELDELNSKITQAQANYNYLDTTQKEHRGFADSVKNILKAKESDTNKWSGIHGVIGEIIRVPQNYETAIEIALGGNINNIVTKDEECAKEAIEYLKRTKGGRATFFPLSTIKGKYFGQEIGRLSQETGVLGVASDIISYNKIYDDIIKNLLGRVLIMDNITNAIALSKKYKYAYKIVTLDGDVINPGGALTGGSRTQVSNNIFGRGRELKQLEDKLSELKNSMHTKKADIAALEEDIKDYNDFIDDKQKEYQDNHMQLLSLEQQLIQTQELIATIKEKQRYLLIEEQQLIEQMENANTILEDYQKDLSTVESATTDIQDKLSQYQNEVQASKVTREDLVSEITNIKVKISSLDQEKNSCLDNIKRIEQDIEEATNEIQDNQRAIDSLEQGHIEKGNTIDAIKKSIEDAKCAQENKNIKMKQVEQAKKDYTIEFENGEKTIEDQLSTISLLEKEIIRIENQKTKLLESRETIYNAIWQEYELTYNSAKQYQSDELTYPQLQKENRQLKAEIKELGNINLDAIEEYKVVSERYEFLTSQRNDIVDAEIKLQKIIEDLTRSMSEQFIEQFKLISDNFGQVFSELFGGGRAYLQLSDDNNILESGIDIIAQPPGKNLQNMMLLSGGERALTAIALLFAILKLKPSPFCILDEIEAALDDANVNRYADYLRKFSTVTQFIVVTHRKGTMEAADILYGVTMQEQGVSKLVSVKFEEAAV